MSYMISRKCSQLVQRKLRSGNEKQLKSPMSKSQSQDIWWLSIWSCCTKCLEQHTFVWQWLCKFLQEESQDLFVPSALWTVNVTYLVTVFPSNSDHCTWICQHNINVYCIVLYCIVLYCILRSQLVMPCEMEKIESSKF